MSSNLTPVQKQLRKSESFYRPFLHILQENGGELERVMKLDDFVPEYTSFSAEDLKSAAISRKTGKPWHPYDFGRNFALKDLMTAGFLTYSSGRPVKLTKKGLECDPDMIDIEKDIHTFSNPYWKQKNEERMARNTKKDEIISDEEETDSAYTADESVWRNAILDNVKQLSPKKFEDFCRGLLTRMGFEMDKSKGMTVSHDFGIDGFGYAFDSQSLKTTRVAIQCKRYDDHPVSSAEINNLRGSVDTNRADYGVFITTSYFSTEAKKSARLGSTPITLIDGEKLIDLMIQYKYKVISVLSYVADETYFEE